jgi:hypothetical protein
MGLPVEAFANVEPLDRVALTKQVKVDTPDSAPTENAEQSQEAPKPDDPTDPSPSRPASAAQPTINP